LAGDGAAAAAVPRARRVPLAHHRLCRSRQRLAAHGRPRGLPRHRHPGLLARHQGGAIRTGLGAFAHARAIPASRARAALQGVRSSGRGARVSGLRRWRRLGHAGLLLAATVYCVFPIYFMLVQSLKSAHEDVFGNPFIVTNPTLENFEELFERKGQPRNFVGRALRRDYPFFVWLENTIVIFGGSVAITLAAGVAAAYALGRLQPPGFRWWRRAIFATYVVPHTILLAYFQNLPREIEESALVEGASRAAAFYRIVLPMSRPVLIAAGIFALGTIASDFMIASVFLLSEHNQTIPAGLATMEVALDELLAVAGINLMAIPVVLLCAVFARGYVRGLTAAMIEGA